MVYKGSAKNPLLEEIDFSGLKDPMFQNLRKKVYYTISIVKNSKEEYLIHCYDKRFAKRFADFQKVKDHIHKLASKRPEFFLEKSSLYGLNHEQKAFVHLVRGVCLEKLLKQPSGAGGAGSNM